MRLPLSRLHIPMVLAVYSSDVGIPSAAVGAVAVILAAVKYGLSSPSVELAFTPITDGTRVGPGLGLRIARHRPLNLPDQPDPHDDKKS